MNEYFQSNLGQPKKWDRLWVGLVAGLAAPFFIIFAVFVAKSGEMPFALFVSYRGVKSFASPILSLGCVMNLLVFFLMLRGDLERAARGVILATFIWAIPIFYTKFF